MQQKLRVIAATVWILLAFINSNAQNLNYHGKPMFVGEEEISRITVGGNVDIVLRNAPYGNTSVKVVDQNKNGLVAKVRDGELILHSAKNFPADQRIVVHVWINDLKALHVSGQVRAVSIGVLNFGNLNVNVSDGATVALQTRNKTIINAPDNYELVKVEQHYSFYSAARQ